MISFFDLLPLTHRCSINRQIGNNATDRKRRYFSFRFCSNINASRSRWENVVTILTCANLYEGRNVDSILVTKVNNNFNKLSLLFLGVLLLFFFFLFFWLLPVSVNVWGIFFTTIISSFAFKSPLFSNLDAVAGQLLPDKHLQSENKVFLPLINFLCLISLLIC